MKPIIKEILDEIIGYGKPRNDKKRLAKPEQEIGFDKCATLIKDVLYWQKMIGLDMIEDEDDEDEDMHKDAYFVDDMLQESFKTFFQYFDDLTEIFSWNKDHIGYNKDLSEDERAEIVNYIHQNYQLRFSVHRNPGTKPTTDRWI